MTLKKREPSPTEGWLIKDDIIRPSSQDSNSSSSCQDKLGNWGGKIYPNGEFSIGYIPPKRLTDRDSLYEENLAKCQNSYRRYSYSYRGREVQEYQFFDNSIATSLIPSLREQLGLSTLPNCHNGQEKLQKRRGLKGVSSYGCKQVRNAAFLLQEKYGKSRLGFYTFTLPVLPEDARLQIGKAWSGLVRKLVQEIVRELKRNHAPLDWCGCTEIQEKRAEKHGFPAPHLHLLFVSRPSVRGSYYLSADWLRAAWMRILSNWVLSLGCSPNFNTRASVDCQPVRKDASGYLGKYLSKGSKNIAELREKYGDYWIPSCYAHVSNSLKKAIKNRMIRFNPILKEIFLSSDYQEILCDNLLYCREIFRVIKEKERRIGFAGRFSLEFTASMRSGW